MTMTMVDRLNRILLLLLFPARSPCANRLRSRWTFLLVADTLALLMLFSPGYTLWGIGLFVAIRAMFLRKRDLHHPHRIKPTPDSTDEAAPSRKRRPGPAPGMTRAVVHVVAVLVTFGVLWQFLPTDAVWTSFPTQSHYYAETAAVIDGWVEKISFILADPFVAITIALNKAVSFIATTIDIVPWPIMILLLTALAWRVGGWRHALWCLASLCFIGFFGFWEKAIDTASVVIASIIICIMIGVPIGIAAAKSRLVNEAVVPVLDFMQTMPSFVYLLPAVAFFSLGKPPAVVATVIFAMPPLIRLTSLGIREVPQDAREAMLANGASTWQLLVMAEIPLAWSTILAGINQCVMLAVAMVVIASLIGSGGLGYDILYALQNVRVGEGVLAGTAIVCIAIIFDRILRSSRKHDGDEA